MCLPQTAQSLTPPTITGTPTRSHVRREKAMCASEKTTSPLVGLQFVEKMQPLATSKQPYIYHELAQDLT